MIPLRSSSIHQPSSLQGDATPAHLGASALGKRFSSISSFRDRVSVAQNRRSSMAGIVSSETRRSFLLLFIVPNVQTKLKKTAYLSRTQLVGHSIVPKLSTTPNYSISSIRLTSAFSRAVLGVGCKALLSLPYLLAQTVLWCFIPPADFLPVHKDSPQDTVR